jgi:hypothetical protein
MSYNLLILWKLWAKSVKLTVFWNFLAAAVSNQGTMSKNLHYTSEKELLSTISVQLRDIMVLLKAILKALTAGYEPRAQGATEADEQKSE